MKCTKEIDMQCNECESPMTFYLGCWHCTGATCDNIIRAERWMRVEEPELLIETGEWS
jgi:hypothetical protein